MAGQLHCRDVRQQLAALVGEDLHLAVCGDCEGDDRFAAELFWTVGLVVSIDTGDDGGEVGGVARGACQPALED